MHKEVLTLMLIWAIVFMYSLFYYKFYIAMRFEEENKKEIAL
jgi:hypothetical protein